MNIVDDVEDGGEDGGAGVAPGPGDKLMVVGTHGSLAEARGALIDAVGATMGHARAARTVAMYVCHWGMFTRWCTARGLPPPTAPVAVPLIVEYLGDLGSLQGKSISTLSTALAAIRWVHCRIDVPTPTRAAAITEYMGALRRQRAALGSHPVRRAASADAEALGKMLAALHGLPPHERLRDAALLTLGFAGGFRRGELAGMRVADVHFRGRGLVVHVPKGKGDQEGQGAPVRIAGAVDPALCPALAMRAYLDAVRPTGALFVRLDKMAPGAAMGGARVATIIRAAAARAGLPDAGAFGGHSLRRGCINTAFRKGHALADIAAHVRHKKLDTTMAYRDTQVEAQDPDASPLKGLV